MRIYQDVLPDSIIIGVLTHAQCPGTTRSVWEKEGHVAHTEMFSEEVHSHLEKYLYSTFLDTHAKKITYSYYVWKVGSSLVMHNDENYPFSATLYLNEKWHPDWGGLFVWEDKQDKELKVLCPKHNTLVINHRHENHMITPVTEFAPKDRLTLQIRGHAEV